MLYFEQKLCKSRIFTVELTLILHSIVFLFFKMKQERSILEKKCLNTVNQLTRMLLTGATSQQIGEIIMQNEDLRSVVKAVFLEDWDEQCRKLCNKSDTSSSVLRVPSCKHKVVYHKYIMLLIHNNSGYSKILQRRHEGYLDL